MTTGERRNETREDRFLRVIGLTAKIRIHQIGPFGMGRIAIRWLQGDENGIDFREDLGVVTFEDPSPLGLIVGIKDAEALDLPVAALFLGPNAILIVRPLNLGLVGVVRVENERFPLGEEDASKGRLRFAMWISVHYVHDMQVARAHQIAHIMP